MFPSPRCSFLLETLHPFRAALFQHHGECGAVSNRHNHLRLLLLSRLSTLRSTNVYRLHNPIFYVHVSRTSSSLCQHRNSILFPRLPVVAASQVAFVHWLEASSSVLNVTTIFTCLEIIRRRRRTAASPPSVSWCWQIISFVRHSALSTFESMTIVLKISLLIEDAFDKKESIVRKMLRVSPWWTSILLQMDICFAFNYRHTSNLAVHLFKPI